MNGKSDPASRALTRAPQHKPAVAIILRREAAVGEVIPLSERMVVDGRLEPVIMVPSHAFAQRLRGSSVAGLRIVDFSGHAVDTTLPQGTSRSGPTPAESGREQFKQWAIALVERSHVLGYAATLQKLLFQRATFARAFAQLNVRSVIVFDDRSQIAEPGALAVSRSRGLTSVLVPYALSFPESESYVRLNKRVHMVDEGWDSWLKQAIAARLPSQQRTFDGKRMLFYQPGPMLALATIGMLSPNPWVMGGGRTDVAFVVGENDRNAAISAGVEPSKVVVAGQPSLDSLAVRKARAEDVKRELINEHRFDQSRPILIYSVPQNLEHGLVDATNHWRTVREVFEVLAGAGANVLLSLHPRSERSAYAAIAEPLGLAIERQPLAHVLPGADVFVSGYSSTVRWALRLGIACVVVDLWNTNFRYFDDFGGLTKVTDITALKLILESLVCDQQQRTALGATALESSRPMLHLDGHACQRIVDWICHRIGI